mgnify:CR=1 FL=1
MHPNKTYIDPPRGWMYGFPREWDGKTPIIDILREARYPEKDIVFALDNMRYIHPVDKEPND